MEGLLAIHLTGMVPTGDGDARTMVFGTAISRAPSVAQRLAIADRLHRGIATSVHDVLLERVHPLLPTTERARKSRCCDALLDVVTDRPIFLDELLAEPDGRPAHYKMDEPAHWPRRGT
jgi:hypothetical protein